MKRNISISDFTFKFSGYGHYNVSYTSPVTRRVWTKTINDMTIIDDTKNADNPKVKDLEKLKRICKSSQT